MRASRHPWTPPAPPRRPESLDHQEERNARIAEMTARVQKRPAKAALSDAELWRISCLQRMLDDLRREHAKAAVAPGDRAGHLADAISDLEAMIARAFFVKPPRL